MSCQPRAHRWDRVGLSDLLRCRRCGDEKYDGMTAKYARAAAPPVEPDPWRPRNEAEEAIAAERMWEHANTGASGPILNSDEFYGRSPDPVAGLRLDNGLAQDLSRTTTVSHGAWMKWFAHCPDPSAFAALLASGGLDVERLKKAIAVVALAEGEAALNAEDVAAEYARLSGGGSNDDGG